MNKIKALAEYLGCGEDELLEARNNDCRLNFGSQEYLVCTDEEADNAAEECIEESLWAFNSSFLESHARHGITADDFERLQDKCESANPAFKAMIGDFQHFVDDAIRSDGRGHFISGYDGEENGVSTPDGMLFIYRLN